MRLPPITAHFSKQPRDQIVLVVDHGVEGDAPLASGIANSLVADLACPISGRFTDRIIHDREEATGRMRTIGGRGASKNRVMLVAQPIDDRARGNRQAALLSGKIVPEVLFAMAPQNGWTSSLRN